MIIRQARKSDCHAMAKVHVDTWQTTYQGIVEQEILDQLSYESREKRWRELFEQENSEAVTFVAETEEGELVGFINGGPERSNEYGYEGELYSFYILKAYQRQGIGSLLLKELAITLAHNGFESMLVWVLEKKSVSCLL